MSVSRAVEAMKRDEATPVPELRRIFRFIATGALNTIASIAVYQLALFMFGYTFSYCIAYVSGILMAYYAYAKHVFQAPMSVGRLAGFVMFYAVSLLAGAALNAAFVEMLAFSPRLAIFATVAVMLPVNYIGSKFCLLGFPGRSAAGDRFPGADRE